MEENWIRYDFVFNQSAASTGFSSTQLWKSDKSKLYPICDLLHLMSKIIDARKI